MYNYLVVGSGLYGAIFAHEAKAHGKSVLVVDKWALYATVEQLRRNMFSPEMSTQQTVAT